MGTDGSGGEKPQDLELQARVEKLERSLAECRATYARLLAHQNLLDERLLRIERHRAFRLWSGFVQRLSRLGLRVPPAKPRQADTKSEYARWVAAADWSRFERLAPGRTERDNLPRVSVVTIANAANMPHVELFVASLTKQTYPDWELSVGFEASARTAVQAVADRIRALAHPVNLVESPGQSVPEMLRAAIAASTGEYVLVLGGAGVLAPLALQSMLGPAASRIAGVIYADEDRMGAEGQRSSPLFKPDWSPDLLEGAMYLGDPVLVRRDLYEQAANDSLGKSTFADTVLRAACKQGEVVHVPEVLFSRFETSHAVLAEVSPPLAPGAAVAAIVCSRNADLARRCLSALRAADLPLPLDVVVVAHEPEGENVELRGLAEEFGCTVRPYWGSFDFASMNNLGADGVETPYLLFINDDVIVKSAHWARTVFGLLGRDDVGMVGTTLLYPSGQIQHAGIAVGIGDGAGHIGRFDTENPLWPWLRVTRNVSAVTGALMAIRASTFATLGGFDAAFPNNYNDVDLCLRARALGLEVICVATSEIIHEECRTRAGVTSLEERDRFYTRYAHVLSRPDPYYSPNLAPTEAIALNFEREPRFKVLRDAGAGF